MTSIKAIYWTYGTTNLYTCTVLRLKPDSFEREEPMAITLPRDPIAAVTHPDPYPYYADLVAYKPIYHDETLGLWVASSANAVSAVLASEICRVRPLAEPVPR